MSMPDVYPAQLPHVLFSTTRVASCHELWVFLIYLFGAQLQNTQCVTYMMVTRLFFCRWWWNQRWWVHKDDEEDILRLLEPSRVLRTLDVGTRWCMQLCSVTTLICNISCYEFIWESHVCLVSLLRMRASGWQINLTDAFAVCTCVSSNCYVIVRFVLEHLLFSAFLALLLHYGYKAHYDFLFMWVGSTRFMPIFTRRYFKPNSAI